MFDMLCYQLSRYRADIITNVIGGKMPSENFSSSSDFSATKTIIKVTEETEESTNGSESIKSVRFTKSVPKFLGSELEIYGPYEENDIASLPSKIANILIKKERAEEMQMN